MFVINRKYQINAAIWSAGQRCSITSQTDEDREGKEDQGPVAIHAGAEGLHARPVRVAVQTGRHAADAPRATPAEGEYKVR